ncbi:EKC/KEOPS complex subunit LAGE3-like [Mizuhopecten yessoensis]|uniref:EKC/KEOPS complex subunit LAGE3-like n=1 Tax=Mizuhopecten yessoensis TaxID=6573 RepID=UPI000B45C5DA|nr:EKC/KEOPS complex subunit LAGE3-like [Mizuhopecten yessoensis]
MEQKSEYLSINLCVPFPSKEEATIAYGSLSVDKEPKRGGGKKSMVVKDNQLHVHFEAKEARLLRVSVNSFFEYLNLVVQTMDQFGPPLPATT